MVRLGEFGGNGTEQGAKRRFVRPSLFAMAVGLAAYAALAQTPAKADDQQLQLMEDQIRQLQAQIDAMKKMQAQAAAAPAKPAAIGSNNPAYGYETGSHQFGWVSADGRNSIELTGRIHLDVGSYTDFTRESHLNQVTPQGLDSGFNARRARIGVTGRFAQDFNYTLIAEFGGSSDTTNPFVSGFTASNIENAYITYNGLNKPDRAVPLAFDMGYLDVPLSLDEAVSSNDTMFMERSSSQVVAVAIGGGDNRSALGVRSYKTQYWGGAYVTGPTAGAAHTNQTALTAPAAGTVPFSTSPSGEPVAVLGRFTYNPIQDDANAESIHIGANVAHLVNPGSVQTTTAGGAIAGSVTSALTLSDRPELRIDPTSFLSTGAIAGVRDASMYGLEGAVAWQQFYVQGEGYLIDIDRFGVGRPDLSFSGEYLEASYSIGGRRHYNASTGAYTGVIPDAPLSLAEGGGWGAVELALRYSDMNLNDKVGQVGSIVGGDQRVYAAGVNYYVNSNMRFMFDYLHTDFEKADLRGVTIDAIAARAQVAF